MNSHHYGVPKELYRTSFSPMMANSRPSSLQNLSYAQSKLAYSPMVRQDQPNHISALRQISKNSLEISQASIEDQKIKKIPHEYYPDNNQQEWCKLIDKKYEELAKKVNKNTQEIKMLKQESQNKGTLDSQVTQELRRQKTYQENCYQECLAQIKAVKELVMLNQNKAVRFQSVNPEKTMTKSDQKQLFKFKALIEERVKQETAKIKLIIENQISKISHEFRWQMQREKQQSTPLKSKMKYPFSSLKIVHSEQLQVPSDRKNQGSRLSTRQSADSPRAGKLLLTQDTTYYLDRQGFLLDENNFYLLDSQQKMIRLSQDMIQKLRRQGMLD